MRTVLLIAGPVVLLVLARMCFFTVDPTEFVYVTHFGQPVAIYDGSLTDTDAGLHVRWPWPVQSVQRLDRRLQVFDLPAAELLTHDPVGKTVDKTITVEAYVCWRIADKEGVDRFIKRVGTPERARDILGQRVSSELGALVGQIRMDDLIVVDEKAGALPAQPGKVEKTLELLRQRLLTGRDTGDGPETDGLRGQARKDYGIELVDIRLRRFNHPASARDAIFERIRKERETQSTK